MVSKAGIEQRQQAAKTHGAYSFERRGEIALEPAGRTRLMELREACQDRKGVLALLQEKAADSVLLFELVNSFVAGEVKRGKTLGEIAALNRLPQFANSMQRALSLLLDVLGDDEKQKGVNSNFIEVSDVQQDKTTDHR
jgi:hypothetical protein